MKAENAPLISVVLPVYNGAPTLSRCMGSLLDQSGVDFEIVAVDDGSTDSTARRLREFQARDDRVRPVLAHHGGIVTALNRGIFEARGRYVARMDVDDECCPDRLRLQAEALASSADLGLVGGQVVYGGDRKRQQGYALHVDWLNKIRTSEAIRLNRFVESPFAHPSVMFRRELIERFGGYRDGAFPEDYELWLRWLDAGVVMTKVDAPVVVWNDPDLRLSRTDERYAVEAFYRCKAEYLARWLKRKTGAECPRVAVWGAGRTTRKRAEWLTEFGVRTVAYIDIDPRKIGQRIHGRPVVAENELEKMDLDFIVSYVGSRGARSDIRRRLNAHEFIEGKHYIMAA